MTGVRPPAVVLGGGPAGLAIVRSLGGRRVPVSVGVSDVGDAIAASSRFAAEAIELPNPLDDEAGFADALLRHARDGRLGGAVLFPTSDAAVRAVTRHAPELGASYRLTTVDERVAQLALDKLETVQLAERARVPTPLTVEASPETLGAIADDVGFPCVLKPASGFTYEPIFHVKWARVRDADELRHAYEVAAAAGQTMMAQRQIPGPEQRGVSYNAYATNGEVRVDFTSRKLRNAPPLTGAPSVVRSEPMPAVTEFGRRVVREMQYDGFVNIEFKQDPTSGAYNLLDINPRHNLSAQLAVTCGVDFPWIQYRHATDGVLVPPSRAAIGVHWTYLLRDVKWAPHYLRRPGYSVRRMVRPYARRHVDAIARLDDPKPFLTAARLATVRRSG